MRTTSQQPQLKAIIDGLKKEWHENTNKDYLLELADTLSEYRDYLIGIGAVAEMDVWDFTKERLNRRENLSELDRRFYSSTGDILRDLKFLLNR